MTTIEKRRAGNKSCSRREDLGSFRGVVRITAKTPSSERYLMAAPQRALF
jgi:hypothetical protein